MENASWNSDASGLLGGVVVSFVGWLTDGSFQAPYIDFLLRDSHNLMIRALGRLSVLPITQRLNGAVFAVLVWLVGWLCKLVGRLNILPSSS